MMSPESENLPKPDPKHGLLRHKAFFEVFRPALNSGERLDLARARRLLAIFNRKYSDWNSAEIKLTDVFYASLRSKSTTNSHVLSLGFLALDDLKETIGTQDQKTAFVMEAERAFIDKFVTDLLPPVGPKAPKGSSVHN